MSSAASESSGDDSGPDEAALVSGCAGAGQYAPVDHEPRKRPGLALSDVDTPKQCIGRQRCTQLMAAAALCDDEKLYLFRSESARRGAVLARVVLVGYYNFFHAAGARAAMRDEERKLRLFREVQKAILCVQAHYPSAMMFERRPELASLAASVDDDDEEEEDDGDDERISNDWKTALIAHKTIKPAAQG